MRQDDGMTVVELLLAIVILIIIMAPLATSFVIGMSTTRGSDLDAGGSADAQVLAAAFDVDVASALTIATTSGTITCGSGTGLLQLHWRDGGIDRYVAYGAVLDPARRAELHLTTDVYILERVVCSDNAGTQIDRQVMARTLKGVPTVSCDKGACSSTPRRITLKTVSYATQTPDAGTPGQYTASVTATRKVTP